MTRVIIFLSLIVFSCGTKPSDTEKEFKTDSLTVETSIDKVSPNINEDFNKFFETFRNDSLFQLDRVSFPLTTMIWEIGDDNPRKTTIQKDDWRFLNFHYDESFAKRQLDPYTQEIKVYGDTVKLEIRGVDNGIYTDFEFARQKGKWYLVAVY